MLPNPESSISVFSLEDVVVRGSGRHLIRDIKAVDLDPDKRIFVAEEDMVSLPEYRSMLGRWCIENTRALQEVCKATYEQAPYRISAWTRIVMRAEIAQGRHIFLVGSSTPTPIVDAYAQALRRAFKDESSITAQGAWFDEAQELQPFSALDYMQEEHHGPIEVVASKLIRVAQCGKLPILANPLKGQIEYEARVLLDIGGNKVVMFHDDEPRQTFNVMAQRIAFLNAFYAPIENPL